MSRGDSAIGKFVGERAGTFFFEHLETKGAEAARACVHTIDALERLPASA